jgi:hypothetical protein
MAEQRILCQFSCGAASAVATKLALAQFSGREIVIINAFIKVSNGKDGGEHEDNRRFAADCEKWFGHPITILRDEKFGADPHEVFRRERYMGGRAGAPCARGLKRKLFEAFQRPSDEVVIGYSVEEQWRVDNILDANADRKFHFPLIERGLGKSDCLAMVERAGIELPMMYQLGYDHANCIGCVKGGEGYWNKVRRDFPEVFNAAADIQESIGPGAYLFRHRSGPLKGQRYGLRQLPPNKGRYKDEPAISCGFQCEMAEAELTQTDINGSAA